MCRLGRGGPKDDAAAFSYYSRVADAFSDDETDDKRLRITVDALVQVAEYYRLGSPSAGIHQDFARAMRIYNLAATYGHPAAQYALGVMHLRGQGIEPSPQQGLKWLFKAARARYALAEAELGDLYWKGQFVQADRTRALMWYILAKETAKPDENPEIHDRLDEMLAVVSDEERLEAEARATVWSDEHPAQRSAQNAAD
jgi:TPR repeat protein